VQCERLGLEGMISLCLLPMEGTIQKTIDLMESQNILRHASSKDDIIVEMICVRDPCQKWSRDVSAAVEEELEGDKIGSPGDDCK
jgi:hypothetical protein